ncbi:MAG: STAS domain-containing protein, partial [Bacillota bacterium]
MDITKKIDGNSVTITLAGRLDVVTSNQLSSELANIFEQGEVNLVFDFGSLEYISSAGLRVMLTAQKKVNAMGTTMKIINVSETVKE